MPLFDESVVYWFTLVCLSVVRVRRLACPCDNCRTHWYTCSNLACRLDKTGRRPLDTFRLSCSRTKSKWSLTQKFLRWLVSGEPFDLHTSKLTTPLHNEVMWSKVNVTFNLKKCVWLTTGEACQIDNITIGPKDILVEILSKPIYGLNIF